MAPKRQFILLSYLLTTVGYMTLTLSLPLLSYVASHLHVTHDQIQQGLALLFLMFSVSAIVLSTLSDTWGAKVILKYAQGLSIAGLIIMGSSTAYWAFVVGCFCVGLGTGCYASIARSLISHYAEDDVAIKKGFSTISLLLVTSPFLASLLTLLFAHISWRLVYFVMAGIEVALLLFAMMILQKSDTPTDIQFSFKAVGKRFHYCLTKSHFLLNMLSLGILFSIYMQLFSANLPLIVKGHFQATSTTYFIASLCMTAAYMIGILCFRGFAHNFPSIKVRLVCITIMIVGVLLLFLFSSSLLGILAGILTVAFGLGLMVPLSTSDGMTVISQHFGSAAALYTSSFSLIASAWSAIQGHVTSTPLHFVTVAVLMSIVALLFITVGLLLKKGNA